MPLTRLHEQALALHRELGDKPGIGVSLVNMGHAAMSLGDYTRAQSLLEESLSFRREIGGVNRFQWPAGAITQASVSS